MDQTWVSIIFFSSAVCGVSAYVPRQYVFVNESKNWTEAQSYCRQNYTDLATISNMEEMKKLNSTLNTLKNAPNSSVWIGLKKGLMGNGYGLLQMEISIEVETRTETGGVENLTMGGTKGTTVCGVSAYVPRQYVFVNESKPWTEAQSYCRQNYTDLATISNMEEMKKLNATLNNKPRSPAWIGLARGDTGKWLWSLADRGFYEEGDTYRNWNSGPPKEPNNDGGNEYCVGMFMDSGNWFDVKCNDIYTSVCYDEKKTSTKRYVFINETKNWYDAQSYCREHHTDLVSVRNQTENQLIFNISKNSSNSDRVWIGLFNDSWQWSDQSDSSFRYWMSGPENYAQGEMCAAVFEQGYWNNVACNNKLPFICYENKLILIKQNLTWREALRYCRDNHVDLVSVHSEEIQLWVKEVSQNASTELVWLGLRHTCTPGFWYWLNVSPMCYQNWAPGNGTGGEDCSPVERTGAVQARGGQQWVSLPEDHKLNFICLTYEG
ncbi:macrophage mannose receptor 1-like [Pygocentrus nattereri]|uniref:macrophage mannose receptor 1-like n=1 Tax=Pygocentrus nattereri TaxID=42514 RepID=UPI0018917637|nr:macrophage mannose receptor 1-like [Pygocentrus nattereri]